MDTRVRLDDKDLRKLFQELERVNLPLHRVAMDLGVHPRTLRDWRRGKFTIPVHHFRAILLLIGGN